MSDAKKGKTLSEEHRKKISNSLTGKERPNWVREKISKSHIRFYQARKLERKRQMLRKALLKEEKLTQQT